MTIREFSPEGTPRAKIAFVGGLPKPEDVDWFGKRQFACESCTPEDLRRTEYAIQLEAVIWTQNPEKLNTAPREMGTTVPQLLDHDVRVYIRLATDENLTETPRKLVVNSLLESKIPVANLRPEERHTILESPERENNFLMPCVYIFESAFSWPDIATVVCDRPADPSPSFELRFDETFLHDRFGFEGHAERVLLLRRAFRDCSELQLSSLDGGLSGAPAFKAYASLGPGFGLVQRGATGAYPHLYFVKIGPRKKIVDEYDNYCGRIFEYVPFHLAPRLRRDRCNLASTQGILVGDFVESSESLITCARGARCVHVISNLFDKTLGGWRKQKRPDTRRSLRSYLETRWQIEGSNDRIALPPDRADLVRQLGADADVVPLKKVFEDYGNTSPLVAPAHGDMHATNVLVRHGDAILIDFEKLEQDYPLTYDPASLEGGLLTEGFLEDLEKGTFEPTELIQRIEPLYELSALRVDGTTFCRRGDLTEWFFDAVNQIRTLSWAAENEPGQYALTLALCLIRKGCNPHPNLQAEVPNVSRAIAFVFGQKILRAIAAKQGGAPGETTAQPEVAK